MPASVFTVWLTGLSASGKSTLALEVSGRLWAAGRPCILLDGDEVRRGLGTGLGYGEAGRRENIRRVAEVARLSNASGIVAVVALISPLAADREMARDIVGRDAFIEVFLDTPLSVCESRDPKGLYRKARAGDLMDFTGISAPYEIPENPDLVFKTVDPRDAAAAIIRKISEKPRRSRRGGKECL